MKQKLFGPRCASTLSLIINNQASLDFARHIWCIHAVTLWLDDEKELSGCSSCRTPVGMSYATEYGLSIFFGVNKAALANAL